MENRRTREEPPKVFASIFMLGFDSNHVAKDCTSKQSYL